MKCSLIVRCYNEETHLPVLLESLEQQTVRPDEVLVVDSGSTDNTVRIARSFGARVLHIKKENFSFGRSLNLGADAAQGKFLAIASAHVYPLTNEWLENLLVPLDDNQVALVYGRQCGDERTRFSEHQIFKQWFPQVSCPDQGHAFCNNANAVIRRSVWETLRYDEHLPGMEDVQWGKRATEMGFKVAYRADAIVAHVHLESYRQIFRRYRREAIGLRSIFPWESMSLRQALSLYCSSLRSDLIQARREGVLFKVGWTTFAFRAAQYWGAYRGLNWHSLFTNDVKTRLYYPLEKHQSRQHKMQITAEVARKDAH